MQTSSDSAPTLRVEGTIVIDDVFECFTCGAGPGERCADDCKEALALLTDMWGNASQA